MGLREVLAKLKLVELEAPAPSAAPRTDPPDVEALLRSLPPPSPIDERQLAATSHELAADPAAPLTPGATAELPGFDAVYRAAGIVDPKHGFTAFKVLEILASPELAELDGRAKASALSAFLKMNPSGPVPIADVLQDAVRRDQALDQFEKFLAAKLAERATAAERQIARLQQELDELERKNHTAIETERAALAGAVTELERWRARKRAEERRLADAVAPFVDGNPITTS